MSIEIHVLFQGKLPSKGALQRAMKELGFPFTITPATGSLEQQRGFMPMRLRQEETGVEFDVFDGRDAVAEVLRGDARVDAAFDRRASFRWGGDTMEAAAGACAAAALAKLVNGIVSDEYAEAPLSIDAAVASAQQLLQPVLETIPARRTGVGLKTLLKPLLQLRPDLALVGQRLIIRPVRHLLRGVLFTRAKDGSFDVWRYIEPLYGDGYADDFKVNVEGPWQTSHSYLQPLLFDVMAEDIFSRLGSVTTFVDFVAQIEHVSVSEVPSFVALVLAGERERVTDLIRDIEQREDHWHRVAEMGRNLLTWEPDEVCARFHAREKFRAERLKLTEIWEPTPFPAEVPAAERPRCRDPEFPLTPWVASVAGVRCDLPDSSGEGETRFAQYIRWDRIHPRAYVPITREEAQARHEKSIAYDQVRRLPGGVFLGLRREWRNANSPEKVWSWSRIGTAYVTVESAAGRIRACFEEKPDPPQVLTLFTLETQWRRDVYRYRHYYDAILGVTRITCRQDRQISSYDRPPTGLDLASFVVPLPAFGDVESLLRIVLLALAYEGYDEFIRHACSEGWAPQSPVI